MKPFFRRMQTDKDWEDVNRLLPILRVEDTTGIVAVNSEGVLVAACVMDNWTENSVQCHLLLDDISVIRYGFLDLCFDFIFNRNGRKVMYGLVPGNNSKALKLNKHLGFTEKCRFEGAFEDNVDYVIMELKKENCKYISFAEAG